MHVKLTSLLGGAIGAGLFVGSGGPLYTGGPGATVLGFIIVGFAIFCTMQALAEMGVMYPVNGAFFSYCVRVGSTDTHSRPCLDMVLMFLP